MAGTVWQWCLNKLDKPEVSKSRAFDFDRRVLRGGSWGGSQDYARSATRGKQGPHNRNDNLGFRVVCSWPIVGR